MSHGRLRLGLEVVAHEIGADRMAEDAVSGGVDRNVVAALPERDHEFDLMVKIAGGRGTAKRTSVRHGRRGRFAERERFFAFRIAAHLDRMAGIVASDAEHPGHGKRSSLPSTEGPTGSIAGMTQCMGKPLEMPADGPHHAATARNGRKAAPEGCPDRDIGRLTTA